MKHVNGSRLWCVTAALLVCAALSVASAYAQGVTTASVAGVVKDAQGAVIPGANVIAVHEPSGSTYEAVTQADIAPAHIEASFREVGAA